MPAEQSRKQYRVPQTADGEQLGDALQERQHQHMDEIHTFLVLWCARPSSDGAHEEFDREVAETKRAAIKQKMPSPKKAMACLVSE